MTELDRLDLEILAQLQDDGRRSYTDIARTLGVSVGTVRNRMDRLRRDGTLHVMGRADPHAVGFHAPANLHVGIRPPQLVSPAATAIAAFPEVSYVALVAGDRDIEVDVMCRDLEHLTAFVTERLSAVPGVHEVTTNVVLRVVKYGQPDPRLARPPSSPSASRSRAATAPTPQEEP